MKTHTSKTNNHYRWKSTLRKSFLRLCCWASLSPALTEKTNSEENETLNNSKSTSKNFNSITRISGDTRNSLRNVHAALVDVVSRLQHYLRNLSLNGGTIAKTFPRILVGFICLMVLAPYADVFYTRLDFNDRVSPEVWYYESYHWLFLCLGPYLKSVFFTIGLYLVFAQRSSILSLVAAYALMYDIGKIFWLLQVSNHAEYQSFPTGWFYAYGFLSGVFIVLITDLLVYWLNHRVEAIKRRLHGLRNIADKADPQMIVSGFVRTMDDDIMIQQFKQP